MKTAISIDDKVFLAAEQAAEALGVSRSELYSRAVKEYVTQHLPSSVTEIYSTYYASTDNRDREILNIAAETLAQVEWE